MRVHCFFFNDSATTEIYTLSLHDALPICGAAGARADHAGVGLDHARLGDRPAVDDALRRVRDRRAVGVRSGAGVSHGRPSARSEEHTSELQSRQYLVFRLLLEKKKIVSIE